MNLKHIIITTAVILLVCSGTASATTHTVCASGCDYTTIHEAVAAASSYDIIEVQAGTYHENVVISTAHLTIKGVGLDVVHVTATIHVFNVDASYVNITGMNITGAGSSYAGIHLEGGYDYCNFSYNRIADCYDGIVVRGGGNDHNLVLNNTITGPMSDIAIMVRDSAHTNVTGNYIHHVAYATFIRDTGTGCFVYGNWIKHNTAQGLYQFGTASDLTFYDNWVENCTKMASIGTAGTSWNITKRSGTNIFGGLYIGGNYWDDYAGVDNDGDGLGNTALPYTDGGNITTGGDYLPLCTAAGGSSPTRNCARGDICVNQTHWWRDDAPINATGDPLAAGIGAAVSYQTVYVFNGSYTENVVESNTPYLTVTGEGRSVVHVTPTNANNPLFHVHTDADHFNISGIHGSGTATACRAMNFEHVSHGNVTNCNFSNNGFGVVGEHGNYMRVVGTIMCNNSYRGCTFPYFANNSYFADNIIMDNGGRGLDLCTHGDNSVFKNNTVLRNGLGGLGTHHNGINTHWSDNILYEECRSYGNYGSRDHLIRNDANNITDRNPANPVGESWNYDIEDNDCEWKIENTDGQIFTENSGATAYTYPSNFSMQRKNAAETFTVTLTPMTLLSTDDQVMVTSIIYNNAMYTEKYNITADCTDTSEVVTYTATVANASGTYRCYIGGTYDHSETAVAGVVTWSYTGGFTPASPKALSIMWGVVGTQHIPPDPSNLQHTISGDWVNYTWSVGVGNDTDSYNVLHNNVWGNGSGNVYLNSEVGAGNWSNITVYAYNSSGTGSLSSANVSQNTQVLTTSSKYIPPNPINIINNTGSDWIKHLWDVGTGNVTDSYNVCVNNIWYNGTINTYYKKTYTKDNWQNITVFAYNNSAGGTLSLSSISQNTFLEYTGSQYFSKLKIMITGIIPLLSDVLLLVIAYVPVLIGIVVLGVIMSICIGVFGKLKRW